MALSTRRGWAGVPPKREITEEMNDNMDNLEILAEKDKDVSFVKHFHLGLQSDAKTTITPGINGDVKKFYEWNIENMGYSVLGKWQFVFTKGNKKISCIKGYLSNGKYEIYGLDKIKLEDIERYDGAEEVLNRIKELLE